MKVTNEKGITLISLIITVVILLVLVLFTDLIIPDDVVNKAGEAEEGTTGLIHDAKDTISYIKKGLPDINEQVNITLTVSETVGVNSATITAIGTINTEDTLYYTLTLSNGNIYETNTTGVWNISDLIAKTTYTYTVKVTAGENSKTAEGEFTTEEKPNSAPVIVTNEDYRDDKTTSSFTIAMKATDAENDALTYTLYVSASENGTYYTVGTATGSSGTAKTIAVTKINGISLTEYGQYWWKVKVTDGNGGEVTSSPLSLYTYCSGESAATASWSENTTSCGACNGSGNACGGSTYQDTAWLNCECGNGFYVYYDCCSGCSWISYSPATCSDCGTYFEPVDSGWHESCGYCSGGSVEDSYYYCSICRYKSYSQSEHNCYCSHGVDYQHDSAV